MLYLVTFDVKFVDTNTEKKKRGIVISEHYVKLIVTKIQDFFQEKLWLSLISDGTKVIGYLKSRNYIWRSMHFKNVTCNRVHIGIHICRV